MIRLLQVTDIKFFEGKPLVLYGFGKWGKKCLALLESRQIEVSAICDQRYRECMEQDIQKKRVFISPENLRSKKDVTVLIAMEKFESVLPWLNEFLQEIFIFWNENQVIYRIKSDCELLGCKTKEALQERLRKKKKIALVGDVKHREDFKYVFDDIKIVAEYERWNRYDKGIDLLIWCEEREDGYEGEQVEAKDLFTLLTGDQGENIKPYIMMMQTYFAPMIEQPLCSRPFTHAVINSNYEFHFCCGDWSLGVQNILKKKDLQDIWNSMEARIYRLSMINRTYSFCRWERCVYLKAAPKENKELNRLDIVAEEIPNSLEIGIDKTCNLFCKSCRDCVIVENGKRKENIEEARNVIKDSGWLEKCKTLLLGGQGEVFFSPVYRDLLYQVDEKRKTLDIRTNGVLLSEEEFDKLRKNYKVLKIIVSVDAATKETYQKLRRSHDVQAWDKLIHNLKMLSQKRKCGFLDFLQINMCTQMENYMEIPEFLNMGEALFVDKVYLTPIRNWGTYTEKEFDGIRIFDRNKNLKPEVRKVMDEVKSRKWKMQLEIAF